MKKILIFVICSILICASMASCSKGGDSGIVGKWEYILNEEYLDVITQVIADDRVYSAVYYEFYEDGTGCTYTKTAPEKVAFEYTYEGSTLTMHYDQGSPFSVECKVSGDKLTITEGGEATTFKRK